MSDDEIVTYYQRYKKDTALFTTWLTNTAKACGWKSSRVAQRSPLGVVSVNRVSTQTKSRRLKGKARKASADDAQAEASRAQSHSSNDASTVNHYTVTSMELLEQVKVVAQSTSGIRRNMPGHIHRALQKAIDARRRSCDWYQRRNLGTQESNDGHRRFVDLLTTALEQLPRGIPRPNLAPSGRERQSPGQENDTAFTRNAFAALKVEDTPEEQAPVVADVAPTGADIAPVGASVALSKSTASDSCETHVYELEEDRHSELAFIVFSFFEDLHRLRTEMKRVWSRVNAGDLSLIQATILTAAALSIVRKSEEEVYRAYTTIHEPTNDVYAALLNIVFFQQNQQVQCPAESLPLIQHGPLVTLDEGGHHIHVLNQEDSFVVPVEPYHLATDVHGLLPRIDPRNSAVTEFDNFVFLPAGRTLERIMSSGVVADKSCDWPRLVPRMEVIFECSGTPFTDTPRLKAVVAQDEFICQLLQDMHLQNYLARLMAGVSEQAKQRVEGYFPSWNDPLYATMQQVWSNQHVTTTMVWAAQLVYDIHEALQGRPLGQRSLQQASLRVYDTFKLDVNVTTFGLTTGDVFWDDKDSPKVDALFRRLRGQAHRPWYPPFFAFKKDHLDRFLGYPLREPPARTVTIMHLKSTMVPRQTIDPPPAYPRIKEYGGWILPNPDPAFLHNANVLLPGTLLLDVATLTEEVGLALANKYRSIFATAHIYNALLVTGLSSARWPEMDHVIKLHKGAIFANDVPSSPKDIYPRFAHRAPGAVARFLDYRGIRSEQKASKAARKAWNFKPTTATKALRNFFELREDLSQVLRGLSAQAELYDWQLSQTANSPAISSAGADGPSKTKRKKVQRTPSETIMLLEKYVVAALPDMTIDYISLTRRCNHFLLELGEEQFRMSGEKPPHREEDVHCDTLVIFALAVLYDLDQAIGVMEKVPRRLILDVSDRRSALLVAAPFLGDAKRLLEARLTGGPSVVGV